MRNVHGLLHMAKAVTTSTLRYTTNNSFIFLYILFTWGTIFQDHKKLTKRICYLLRVEGTKKNNYFSGPEGCVFEDKYLKNEIE